MHTIVFKLLPLLANFIVFKQILSVYHLKLLNSILLLSDSFQLVYKLLL